MLSVVKFGFGADCGEQGGGGAKFTDLEAGNDEERNEGHYQQNKSEVF